MHRCVDLSFAVRVSLALSLARFLSPSFPLSLSLSSKCACSACLFYSLLQSLSPALPFTLSPDSISLSLPRSLSLSLRSNFSKQQTANRLDSSPCFEYFWPWLNPAAHWLHKNIRKIDTHSDRDITNSWHWQVAPYLNFFTNNDAIRICQWWHVCEHKTNKKWSINTKHVRQRWASTCPNCYVYWVTVWQWGFNASTLDAISLGPASKSGAARIFEIS